VLIRRAPDDWRAPPVFKQGMIDRTHLHAQARRCRMLASGLSNRDDIRTLEELAIEFEARARAIERTAPDRRLASH
jgi:hypothetical protein